MEKLNKKANWALILSVASLVIIVAIIGLWCFKSKEIAVVTLDTFIGIIVALLAVIVTIAIGWQIYAAMDLKSNFALLNKRICEVEALKTKLEEHERKVSHLYFETQHFNQLGIAKSYKDQDEFISAFLFYLSSLKCSLGLVTPINTSPIIKDMLACAQMITGNNSLTKQLRDSFEINDKYIRTSNLFRIIQDEYEEAIALFKEKVNLDDKQK